jgi:hypothetical protein
MPIDRRPLIFAVVIILLGASPLMSQVLPGYGPPKGTLVIVGGNMKDPTIDQHINARNRWDDIIPVVKKWPTLPGLGLSEDPASTWDGVSRLRTGYSVFTSTRPAVS